jgi:integrase
MRNKGREGIYRRGRTWMLDFVHRGERHVVRIGSGITRTVAKEIAQVERAKILRGEAGISRKRRDISFEAARDLFVAWAKANRKARTVESYTECLTRLSESPLMAGKRLSQIGEWTVERYKQDRIKDGVRVRQNRELAVLRNLVNRMRDFKKYEGENPVRHRALIKEPLTKLRYLSHEEERRLVDAAAEPLRTIILVGIHTGLRIESEALELRWADVDLRHRRLTVEAAYSKNGEPRTVPLNSVARQALATLRQHASEERVFIGRGGRPLRSVRNAFETACRVAKLGRDVTPHTLRHTFASRLAMAGVDLRTIQELGGWKTLRLVERYAHVSPSHKAQAIERIVAASPIASPITEDCRVGEKAVSS